MKDRAKYEPESYADVLKEVIGTCLPLLQCRG